MFRPVVDSQSLNEENRQFLGEEAMGENSPQAADSGDRFDFLRLLGVDTSSVVLSRLDDPADIARACSVSRAWRRFVVMNGFCKNLCLRMFPEVSNLTRIIEVRSSSDSTAEIVCGSSVNWEDYLREHRIYTCLVRRIMCTESGREILLDPVSASSTDNYPDESIENTLEPSDRIHLTPSYWSSAGSRDPEAPETLIYTLSSRLCVIHEIKLRPFQAYFQYGDPIYSAKAVRFKIGYSKPKTEGPDMIIPSVCFGGEQTSLNDFAWTYISPVFQMEQVNALQSFKLPRPVLCIGGVLQIELLGRVQQQEMDNLYYICVCHVRVIGNLLFPEFDVDSINADGEAELWYYPEEVTMASGRETATLPGESKAEGYSGWLSFAERMRQMRQRATLLHAFLRNVPYDNDLNDGGSGSGGVDSDEDEFL
ncbi:F-box family protein [Wolffia australiana]